MLLKQVRGIFIVFSFLKMFDMERGSDEIYIMLSQITDIINDLTDVVVDLCNMFH